MRGLAMVLLMLGAVGCSEGIYCGEGPADPVDDAYSYARCPGDVYEGGDYWVICTVDGADPVWTEGSALPANGTAAVCENNVPRCFERRDHPTPDGNLVLGCHCLPGRNCD